MYVDQLQLEDELDQYLYGFGYQLVDLHVRGADSGRIFRVFIDRVDELPVTLSDCAQMAPQVVLFLEAKSIYNDRCCLELSSAGLDRVLKRNRDFERYLGQQVKVTYFAGQQRETKIGELTSFTDDTLLISLPNVKGECQTKVIERGDLERVSLVPQFEI